MTAGPPVVRDERSAAFFDAAARDILLVRRCSGCHHLLEPEARTCTACGGENLDWAPSNGDARLVSWSVVHQAPHPAFAELVPFAIGLVELSEGPWLHARLVGVALDGLHAGQSLTVDFVHPAEGDSYPVFTAGGNS